jgi:general secretion pathway protein B
MSYILEALKKAQAERQLGNAPTIHAPQAQAAQPGVAASRKPLFIGLGAGALVVALGGLLVWHRAPAPVSLAPPAGGAAVPATTGRAAAAPPVAAGSAANTLEVSAPPVPEPAPARPAHAAEAPAHAVPSGAGRAGGDAPSATAAARAPATAPAVPAPAPAAAPAVEDSLPYLSQLPDTIQRDIPRVSFGGYMYSANPADRLLLVDKALRHEGEEVAPGLVLERLLPKAAVMNFRGIRYRVAY